MENKDKHKTPGARSKAFAKFCEGRKSCDYCELGFNKMPEGSECSFYWLELEAKTNARNKNDKRIFNKKLLKDKKIRQHSDGRISIFFTEGIELHTIYLKSADLDRNIEAKQIKQPQEMSEVSLYQWVYWEEI